MSLTAFETILLDCIVTAIISASIQGATVIEQQYKIKKKKNLSILVNFCVAILILKIEENMQHFQHIMLYYFKKGKNATKKQKKKRFVQCMEKVL